MTTDTNDHPAEAAPRKTRGRPAGRINYATRCRELQQRHRHARQLLEEASAEGQPLETTIALIRVALRTLAEE